MTDGGSHTESIVEPQLRLFIELAMWVGQSQHKIKKANYEKKEAAETLGVELDSDDMRFVPSPIPFKSSPCCLEATSHIEI